MYDLILIIVIVGIFIVAGVFAYNIMQERKFKKEGDASFGMSTHDTLLNENNETFNIDTDSAIIEEDANFHVSSMNVEVEEYNDPSMMEGFKTVLNPTKDSPEATPQDHTEDVLLNTDSANPDTAASENHDNHLADAVNTPAEQVDLTSTFELNDKTPILEKVQDIPEHFAQHVDYTALFNFNYQLAGIKLKSQFAKLGRIKNNYKVYIAASNGRWQLLETLQLEAPYIAACAGLQMADRGGAVRPEVIEYFANLSAEIAFQLGTELVIEPAQDAIERAQQLDEFCMAVDQLVSFNLFGGAGAFTGTKLRGLLEANGFELNANGLFTHKNEQGDVLFSVQTLDGQPFNTLMLKTASISGIKFLLDLPHVKNGVATFNQMVLVAKQMESSLQARLLDEQQKPITEAHIDKIRNQIKILQDKMASKQVVPGSELTTRLFA